MTLTVPGTIFCGGDVAGPVISANVIKLAEEPLCHFSFASFFAHCSSKSAIPAMYKYTDYLQWCTSIMDKNNLYCYDVEDAHQIGFGFAMNAQRNADVA